MARNQAFAITGVAVAVSGDTELIVVTPLDKAGFMSFNVTNTGGFALDTFNVYIRSHVDGAWLLFQSTWAATSPTLQWYVETLNTLASAASGGGKMDMRGVQAFRFTASANGTATTVDIRGTVEPQ